MTASERRETIRKILKEEKQPVSAGHLAAELSVSRQIIVGDIALLRAAGEEISATPRGYVLQENGGPSGYVRRIACCHGADGMEAELNAVVDNGCTVLDVIVEHAIYGEITGPLQLKNRYDVSRFIQKAADSSAQPLSALTEGIHLHTIVCPDEAAYLRVCGDLRTLGILLEDRTENSDL